VSTQAGGYHLSIPLSRYNVPALRCAPELHYHIPGIIPPDINVCPTKTFKHKLFGVTQDTSLWDCIGKVSRSVPWGFRKGIMCILCWFKRAFILRASSWPWGTYRLVFRLGYISVKFEPFCRATKRGRERLDKTLPVPSNCHALQIPTPFLV